MRKILLLAFALSFFVGCSSTQKKSTQDVCQSNAKSTYSKCVTPPYHQPGERHKVTRSQEMQSCQQAYKQAAMQCKETPGPDPLFDLTDSSTTTKK